MKRTAVTTLVLHHDGAVWRLYAGDDRGEKRGNEDTHHRRAEIMKIAGRRAKSEGIEKLLVFDEDGINLHRYKS